MASVADLLSQVPLFQFLDEGERADLAQHMKVVNFAAEEQIFSIGDPGDALYVIAEGEAEMYFKNDTGEIIVLERACRGSFFGDLSLMDGGSRSASVKACQDVTLLQLDRHNLEDFLMKHPRASMDLLAAMGRRLRATVEQLRHTATRNVNEELEDKRSAVQKAADWIAAFSGSLTFLFLHIVWFGSWILVNTVKIPGIPQFDPFPYGFLTLTVSLEAIFLSVFVLLSQNRQAAKEHVRSDIEYEVNLKAELEIAHLHEKMDRLTSDVLAGLHELKRRMPAGTGKPTAEPPRLHPPT
jgi:CRP/FNR family transcriptional regulator, cyclic AMP receptor protein